MAVVYRGKTYVSILYLRCKHRVQGARASGVEQVSILYLRCGLLAAHSLAGVMLKVSILYLRCRLAQLSEEELKGYLFQFSI